MYHHPLPKYFTIAILTAIICFTAFVIISKPTTNNNQTLQPFDSINNTNDKTIVTDKVPANSVVSVDVYDPTDPPQYIFFTSTPIAGDKSHVYNLNEVDYQTALNSNKLIILFFTSNICATCDQEFTAIKQAMIDVKHDDVVSFVVHLGDDQQNSLGLELANKFAVASPQTKIFLRNQVKLFIVSDIWSSSRYLSEIYDIIPTDITPGQN